MKTRRSVPCANECGTPVQIQDRERFLAASRGDIQVFCKQCGRYLKPAAARVTQVSGEKHFGQLALRKKRARNAKRQGVLESSPLGRCGVRT